MVRVLILICFALAACMPAAVTLPQQSNGAVAGVATRNLVITDHPHHVLVGHIAHVRRGTDAVFALVIDQRRDGVHRLIYREAYQDGRALPYRSLHRRVYCGRDCRDRSIGMINFSADMVRRATLEGFNATLYGPDGSIDVFAPPSLFQEVLALQPGTG